VNEQPETSTPSHGSSLRNAVARGVTWTSTSAGVLFFLGFAQTAALAHFLDPRDFGLMAALAVVLGFGRAFGDMGISSAIIARHTTSRATLSSLYWLNLAAGISVTLAVAASAPLVADFYNESQLRELLPLAALVFLIRAFGQQFFVLFEREMQFKSLAKIEVASSAVSTAAAIAAAASGAGVYALIVATLTQSTVWSVLLVIRGWRAWRPSFHFRIADVRGYLGFGLYQMGDRSVNFLSSNVDYLLIGRFLGVDALGAYSLAYQLVVKPVASFNPIVTRVAFPAFARRQDNEVALRNGYLEMIRLIAFALTPALVALAATAPVLVPVLFGDKWNSAIVLIEILALTGLLRALSNPVGSLFLAKDRPDIGFKVNVGILAVMTAALYAAVQVSLTTVAVVETAVVAAAFFLWILIVRKMLSLSIRRYAEALVSPLLYAAIAGCVMRGVVEMVPNNISGQATALFAALLGGASVYILLTVAFERPYLRRLVSLFRSSKVPGHPLGPLPEQAMSP
jgi:O-antigen/teichoic acid export membrane protein